MGDASPASSARPIYNKFKSDLTCPHEYGELIVHDFVRRLYPDKHLTVVSNHDAQLFSYAEAGHAKAELLRDDDDFLAIRSFLPAATRLEGSDGKLSDDIRFGLYKYEHKDTSFEVVRAQWYTQYSWGRRTEMHFIVSPKEHVNNIAHCSKADALITAAGKWTHQLHDEVYVFDQSNWFKSKLLWNAVQAASWDDVILDPAMKANIIKDVEGFFDSRAIYEEYKMPWKRGLILHGTPGCGKTITIKALMNSLQSRGVVSLYVKSLENCQGEEYSINEIFEKAREMAPCMLIFEDLDSLVNDKVRSYFLNEVDGLERNDGILMIGSTNHLERLDAGISKRPSRFDRKYRYRLPGDKERIAYCNYWRKKLENNSNVEFHDDIPPVVSRLTEGFSFAYLKELFIQTLLTIVGGRADTEEDEDESPEDADSSTSSNKEVPATSKGKNIVPKMPETLIPEHLQDNTLMRVLHKQARALWREMDNTEDEDHDKTEMGDAGKAEHKGDDELFTQRRAQILPQGKPLETIAASALGA